MEFGKRYRVRFAAFALATTFTLAGCDEEGLEDEDMEAELDEGDEGGKADGAALYLCTGEMLSTFLPCGSILREIAVFVLSGGSWEQLQEAITNIVGGGDAQECAEKAYEWAECHERLYGNHGHACNHSGFSDGVVGNAVISCNNGSYWNASTDNPVNCNDDDSGFLCQWPPGQ